MRNHIWLQYLVGAVVADRNRAEPNEQTHVAAAVPRIRSRVSPVVETEKL